MGLTLKERYSVIQQTALRYRKSAKKGKTKIVDELVETTGYNRKYAIHILNHWGKQKIRKINGKVVKIIIGKPKKSTRKKEKKYDDDVFKALKNIWYIFDCICGKRLAPVLRSMLPVLKKFDEIDLNEEVEKRLQTISPATVDRLLKKEKKKFKIKGQSHTKPGSLLKHQIPIRTFNDWDENKPGFIEIDLVGHEGGNMCGDFCFTLNTTDVYSGWTEPIAIQNKAQKWTFQGLMEVEKRIPFKIAGIDSDNGSEFINAHLLKYCTKNKIQFTRSRPYRKNDSCFVEQKNNSIVRRYVGYMRYDTDDELSVLNEIYDVVRIMINFFLPSMKLIEKTRIGSKVKKKYDLPKTPCQRLIECECIDNDIKEKLKTKFDKYNPAELQRRLLHLRGKLEKLSRKKMKSANNSEIFKKQ